MEFSAKQIAAFIQGEVIGDENATVHTFAKIEEGIPGAISFLSNPKYTPYIYESQSSIILVNKDFEPEHEIKATLIKVDNAYESLAKLMNLYEMSKPKKQGIDSLAFVSPTAHIGENVYVGAFAYIGENTMVDTWSTVGSCAQVGKNCHLSGGVGIGGVLEPLQATPTIIEDNCFIGARSEIVEGVIVEENSVISMGVFIGQSTKIYDRTTGEIHRGRVPAGSVVVPGSLPSADGKYNLNCAVIVKRVDAKTRSKTSINELLRD